MKAKRVKDRRAKRAGKRFVTGAPVVLASVLALTLLIPFYPVTRFPLVAAFRGDSDFVSTSTRAGRLAVFDDVWQTVNDRYYDPNLNGVDWLTQRAIFRALAAEATSNQKFYAVLRQMISLLSDLHTRVYAPEEKFDWQTPRYVGIGISLREIEGLPTVFQVEPESEPARAGMRPGDIIVSLDGQPALPMLQERLRERAGASTLQAARLRAIASLLEGIPGTEVATKWRNAVDNERIASFQRNWHQRTPGLHISRTRGRHAVVEIEAFTERVAREFAAALKGKLRGVRGVVLDLRNNGGGDAQVMTNMAAAFLPRGKPLGQFTDRFGGLAIELVTSSALTADAGYGAFANAPLAVLTSERTSSAAEIFVAALREAKRAVIVGTETCGCVLAIRAPHTLPDGGELHVSELDFRTAKGLRLEGKGIVPDEMMKLVRQDLYSGRDRAIELALARLSGSKQ